MTLDLSSVLVMTALVVNVSGILFIVETLLRRDEGAGRVWALAFLAGMLTTLAYIVWAQSPDAWWAVAVGNAAFVAGTGCMWLGCRRFNGRRMAWSSGARRRPRCSAAAIAVVVAGSGRRRLGGSAVDVHPAARLRRRRARSSACAASSASRARRGCSRPCSASSRCTTCRGRRRSSPPAPTARSSRTRSARSPRAS